MMKSVTVMIRIAEAVTNLLRQKLVNPALMMRCEFSKKDIIYYLNMVRTRLVITHDPPIFESHDTIFENIDDTLVVSR